MVFLNETFRIGNDVEAVEAIDGPHLLLQREPKPSAEIVARFATNFL